MNTPFVSVVINTQNRAESLKNYCLPSIAGLIYENFEVIVVVDACIDNTLEVVSSYAGKLPRLTIINNTKPKGISYAKNLGIKQAAGEIIAFTDDDCIVSPSWLTEIIQPFILDSSIMGLWGAIEHRTQTEVRDDVGIGANMAFRRSVFDRFLFDTNIRYFGRSLLEDYDLAERMKYHHFKFEKTSKAKIVHLLLPANYRKITALGFFANGAYIDLKKTSLLRYYFFIFMGFYIALFYRSLYRPFSRRLYYSGRFVNGMVFNSPYYLFKTIVEKDIIKTLKLLYFIFIDIPIRAKIKNLFEEISFRFGVS